MAKKGHFRVLNLGEKLILAVIIIYPLLFIWQGLDFTDTGFLLTNFQQIFNDPASVESSFRIWLTNVLGGIWVYFFGDLLGYVGYKFAAVLLVYATLYVSYLILHPYIEKRVLLFGFLLSLMFINRSGYQFSYNSLTAFFYVLSAYFMIKGLRENKTRLIFISAFVLGLNIFIRLPNVLGFFLVFCIFFDGYLNKTCLAVQVKRAFYFILGYLISILLSLFAMYVLGHLGGYVSALQGAFLMLNDQYGHHRSDKLVEVIVYLHKMVLAKIEFILLGLSVLLLLLTFSGKFRSRFLTYVIILVAASAWVYLYHDVYRDWYGMISSVLGVLYPVLLLHVFDSGKNRRFRLISFTALLILVLAPLGSANGIVNAVLGMYLAIPIAFSYISGIREFEVDLKRVTGGSTGRLCLRLSRSEIKLMKIIVIGLFLVFTIKSAYYYTYRDAGNRWEMRYPVNHTMLKGVLTTAERARVVEDLLVNLPRYVKEDDYLLAYEQISLVYFLTKTRPYLYSSWPMLYSPEKFQKSLNRALQERPYLPVIVRAKGNTEDFNWPTTKGLRKDNYYLSGCRKIMDGFIGENNYKTVWENSFFEILMPPSRAVGRNEL